MLDQPAKTVLVERALYEGLSSSNGSRLLVTEPWVQLTTPGVAVDYKNAIYRSVLDEGEVDERVRATIDEYKAAGLPFLWVIGPSTRPRDLGERLLARGFRLSNIAIGMIADPTRILLQQDPRTVVESVGEGNLDDWIRIQAITWGLPSAAVEQTRTHKLQRLSSGDDRTLDFLVRLRGVPAGVGSMVFCNGYVHLVGGAVLPEHREQGVFRSLLAFEMELLRARGERHATTHALKSTSAPMLLKFGFESVYEFFYYGYFPSS